MMDKSILEIWQVMVFSNNFLMRDPVFPSEIMASLFSVVQRDPVVNISLDSVLVYVRQKDKS